MCPDCHQPGGSLLHCLSTLTLAMSNTQNPVFTIRICAWLIANAVYFCCTVLGVASTGCYPASCPVKPGLSSPAVFRHLQPRSFVLLELYFFNYVILLYMKTASTDEFPQNRIMSDIFSRNRKKIIKEFQQPFCLGIFRAVRLDRKEQRLCI